MLHLFYLILVVVSMFILGSIKHREMHRFKLPTNLEEIDHLKLPDFNWIEEREFVERVVLFGKTLYYQGDISYLESINKETLKNAYDRLREKGILLTSRPRAARQRSMVALHPSWCPMRQPDSNEVLAQGPLWEMVDRVGGFRREGKNRRDNATVSHRVLVLAEKIGQSLSVNGIKSKL